ncbi:MAG: hypothetical protein KDD89_11675, partial [Anaerolineales bacterium]|nr:hypothetical protein [Anaerolineales bacterium]
MENRRTFVEQQSGLQKDLTQSCKGTKNTKNKNLLETTRFLCALGGLARSSNDLTQSCKGTKNAKNKILLETTRFL